MWLHPGMVKFVLHVFALARLLFTKAGHVRRVPCFPKHGMRGSGRAIWSARMSILPSHRPFTCAGNRFSELHPIYDVPSASLVTLKTLSSRPANRQNVHVPLSVCSQYHPLYVPTTRASDSLTRFKPSACACLPNLSFFSYLGA